MIRPIILFILSSALLWAQEGMHVGAPVFTRDVSEKKTHLANKITPPQTFREPEIEAITVEATHYTAFCNTGCTGVTATGYDVSTTTSTKEGYGIIAVDPNVIPLYSLVEIDGRTYQALDTGGDIKGHRIDILVESKKKARTLGRVEKEVILESKKEQS